MDLFNITKTWSKNYAKDKVKQLQEQKVVTVPNTKKKKMISDTSVETKNRKSTRFIK